MLKKRRQHAVCLMKVCCLLRSGDNVSLKEGQTSTPPTTTLIMGPHLVRQPIKYALLLAFPADCPLVTSVDSLQTAQEVRCDTRCVQGSCVKCLLQDGGGSRGEEAGKC